MFKICPQAIDPQEVIDLVYSEKAGAVNTFIGTVRNKTQDKNVVGLEFSSYESMAIKKMQEIAQIAEERWPVLKAAIYHRIGKLQIGDIAVVIAVSTPHRKAGFEACQFLIDTLKEVVPIWKKELFEDGEVWVAAHP